MPSRLFSADCKKFLILKNTSLLHALFFGTCNCVSFCIFSCVVKKNGRECIPRPSVTVRHYYSKIKIILQEKNFHKNISALRNRIDQQGYVQLIALLQGLFDNRCDGIHFCRQITAIQIELNFSVDRDGNPAFIRLKILYRVRGSVMECKTVFQNRFPWCHTVNRSDRKSVV